MERLKNIHPGEILKIEFLKRREKRECGKVISNLGMKHRVGQLVMILKLFLKNVKMPY